MNLAEKGERVTMGGKGRGEIGDEAGEVTGVVADAPTTDGLGKRYGTFSGWRMAVFICILVSFSPFPFVFVIYQLLEIFHFS